jgi:hypothetical protein
MVAAATARAASSPMLVAPKPGATITQSQLLDYLFVAPQAGDWLRFRVSIDGNTLLTKTVGFGAEQLHDAQHAFFETQTQNSGIVGQPVEAHQVAGGTLVWKMFVDASDFNDAQRRYAFVAGVIKIGDALFRLGTGPGQPLAAPAQSVQSMVLYGTLPLPDDRSGVVTGSMPEDKHVGGTVVHTVHTIVDFAARDIGMATGLPQARVETWQTTDVPLGVVAIHSTTNGHVYSVELTAFGRNAYRSVITEQFDTIPLFPG